MTYITRKYISWKRYFLSDDEYYIFKGYKSTKVIFRYLSFKPYS